MADKKKAAKALDKKAMKRTKGGVIAIVPAVQQDISIRTGSLGANQKWTPGQISSADGSV